MQRLNPQEHQSLLELAVAEFAASTGFPLAFGGFESRGSATVTAITGHRTLSLRGLCVQTGRGLGGRAMAECRPRLTMDYQHSRHITHDYDAQVLGEGIVTLFAFPVLVDGIPRAVLYGGAREGTLAGAEFAQSAAAVSAEFAREIKMQDEIERRAARLAARLTAERESRGLPGPALEALRSSHAELRSIAAAVPDPALRARIAEVERRLASLDAEPGRSRADRPSGAVETPSGSEASVRSRTPCSDSEPVKLTARELDVISHAALGSTNAEIGRALGLTESTIKSYLKTAMAKLEASTRHAAVSAARMQGLIP
ncbi:helix-turn-helix transcriptional regulator [Leucobacter tenebrionis]|uniref:helix-turn-helix transcriptional regulator n=1 Tax=Leucobacter tenebrionis TaxID=2873270 RepID=UPI001CA71C83|nr:LuxR C-terminal-related transcriptional regulator [Leucobacter tenebrionis]QZY52748.1 LuxR C-terminal-related transcriptional regulator [Leucobacter tenebrionis]